MRRVSSAVFEGDVVKEKNRQAAGRWMNMIFKTRDWMRDDATQDTYTAFLAGWFPAAKRFLFASGNNSQIWLPISSAGGRLNTPTFYSRR